MRRSTTRAILIAWLAGAAPLAATAQPATGQPPAVIPVKPAAGAPSAPATPGALSEPISGSASSAGMTSSGDRSYVLGVGDTIDVAVVGRSDFNTHARIGSDGVVLLPYIGALQTLKRSPGQLADDIRVALEKGGFFANPVVRVDVVGVVSRFVTVLGSVATPGLMPLDREYHLSEIVARAGGRSAAGADYLVLTHEDGKSENYKIEDLATTGGGSKDPVVINGDKIYVPAGEKQVVYMNGQVKSPGAYPAIDGMTVRMALVRAGGLTDSGSEKKVKVNRKGVELKGVKLDATLVQPGDIITVGESLF
jgi:polysaccharide export outer membrane protein